jgi:protein TonB
VKTLAIADPASNEQRTLLVRIEPGYPQALRERSIGGTVRLKVTIEADGNVERAELLGGNPLLGDATIAAVTKWRYSRAPRRTTALVSILFDPQH